MKAIFIALIISALALSACGHRVVQYPQGELPLKPVEVEEQNIQENEDAVIIDVDQDLPPEIPEEDNSVELDELFAEDEDITPPVIPN